MIYKKKKNSIFKFIFILIFLFINIFFICNVRANDIVDNEYLVKYKNKQEPQLINIDSQNSEKELEILKNNPRVEFVEPNYLYRASIIPSDSYFSKQWYLERIQAVNAWDIINSSPDIVIAIIDSGVQINHPDLNNNIWINSDEIPGNDIDDDKNGFIDDVNGWDFTNNEYDPQPKFKEGFTLDGVMHGTIVAGIVAAEGNNATGVSGVTWKSKIMSLKVLDDKGEGDTRDVIRAIDYAISNGADIINFSFIGDGYSRNLETAIRRAYNAGILIVAAAGNDVAIEGNGFLLDEKPMYPVCHDGNNGENMVIGVAAVDDLDQKALFSGYGSNCIDISAPGVSVYSTALYTANKYYNGEALNKYYDGFWSGTSMAVPMVSGAAALIEQLNPKLNRDEVVDILKNNADNINKLNIDYIGRLGSGRLNIYKSLISAREKSNVESSKIIYSPYSAKEPLVNVLNRDTNDDFNFFAYDKNFKGGVNLATGDVSGDGIKEIITGTGNGGGPHVRVFDQEGNLKNHFFAYDKNFRGGVNISVGDVDGDGIEEIVTGAGKGGGPQVKIFELNGNLNGQFFAYDKNFRGGVKVEVINFNTKVRTDKAKIVVAPGSGGGPHIRIFDDHANLFNQFFSFSENFRGGVNLSSIDINNDGEREIVTAAGPGGAPHVRIYNKTGKLLDSFYAYDEDFSGGVNVASVE